MQPALQQPADEQQTKTQEPKPTVSDDQQASQNAQTASTGSPVQKSSPSHFTDITEEAALSKFIFKARGNLPDSPTPKMNLNESSMCPAGVGKSCAILGGRVYIPDQLGIGYHNETWWDAMKNPAMVFAVTALTGAVLFDALESQACVNAHRCQESNPIMRGPLAKKLAVGLSLNAFVVWYSVREKQHGHSVKPLILLWGGTLTHISLGAKARSALAR
jgi:hypothetical protein